MAWFDFGAAVVIFGGLGPSASEGFPGFATWPCVGLLLVALWLFGVALHATPWLGWLNLVFGCAYLLLTAAHLLATTDLIPLHHRRRHHLA
jgi:hypothetical protein